MKKQAMRIATFGVLSAITFVNINSVSFASGNVSSVLPQAGISYALGSNQVSLSNLQQSLEEDTKDSKAETSMSGVSKSVVEDIESSEAVTDETPSASNITESILKDIQSATGAI